MVVNIYIYCFAKPILASASSGPHGVRNDIFPASFSHCNDFKLFGCLRLSQSLWALCGPGSWPGVWFAAILGMNHITVKCVIVDWLYWERYSRPNGVAMELCVCVD